MSGYRVAYPSYVDETLFGNDNSAQKIQNDPQVGLISTSELSRIKFVATSTGKEVSSAQQERERLHKISQGRQAKWPNTIEALREKKERARAEKAEEEEALRRVIDAEEAALQKEKRRLAIERANKILYDETDRVKALHSRLILSDVLQEREAQIALKKQKQAAAKREEEEWHEKQKDMLRKMDDEEDRKDAELSLKSQQLQIARKDQLSELRKRHDKKLALLKREGELMKVKAQEDLRQERDAELNRMIREREANMESMRANEYLQKLKLEEKRREEAEAEKMKQFSEVKEKNLIERRQREAEKFQAKQAARAKMIDIQVQKLMDIQRQNNERLDKQVAEVQEKSAAAQAAKEEKMRNELMATHMSRQQQLRWKDEKKHRQKLEDQYYADQLKQRNAELREEEEELYFSQIHRNKQHQGFLVKQMEVKQDLKGRQKEREVLEAHQTKQWMKDDDDIFHRYSSMCIAEWEKDGKESKPIHLLLQKKAPL